jgi:hypothetical protein
MFIGGKHRLYGASVGVMCVRALSDLAASNGLYLGIDPRRRERYYSFAVSSSGSRKVRDYDHLSEERILTKPEKVRWKYIRR